MSKYGRDRRLPENTRNNSEALMVQAGIFIFGATGAIVTIKCGVVRRRFLCPWPVVLYPADESLVHSWVSGRLT